MSRVLASRPLLACMRHPQRQQSCHYVRNQSYILCYPLAQEQEGLGNERLVLWQKEHRGIGHGSCSCDLFLLDLFLAETTVRNVIFSFPPNH